VAPVGILYELHLQETFRPSGLGMVVKKSKSIPVTGFEGP
jgi:hypothetical protein